MKKIILAAVVASIGSSAFAGPLVFSNGVQLTDEQIVQRQKEGKLSAIVGNSYYEDGEFIMASDSKNSVVRQVQKVREAVRKRQENQDQKRIDRAPAEAARAAAYKAALEAEAARKEAWEKLGKTELEWTDNAKERFEYGINYSLDNKSGNEEYYETEEGLKDVAAYKAALDGLTYEEAAAGYNAIYGETYGNLTREDIANTVREINALDGTDAGNAIVTEGYYAGQTVFETAVDTVRGAATYAFKTASGLENFTKKGDDYANDKG